MTDLLTNQLVEIPAEGVVQDAPSLDQYLFAKNRFLARHQQFPGSNPGLENFRKHYDRVKPPPLKQSTKAKSERMFRLIGSATESPYLHSIEFRIRPEIHMGAYARFFADWERRFARSAYLRGKQGLVSFVVHFIRWTNGDPPDGEGEVPHELLRRELDLQTAALHLFRIRHADRLARNLCGLDVANKERLCPVEVFSPYLRMLRGFIDQDSDGRQWPSRYLSHWENIRRDGTMLAPALPRLGSVDNKDSQERAFVIQDSGWDRRPAMDDTTGTSGRSMGTNSGSSARQGNGSRCHSQR